MLQAVSTSADFILLTSSTYQFHTFVQRAICIFSWEFSEELERWFQQQYVTFHFITDWLRMERISGTHIGHLVCWSRVSWYKVSRTVPSQILTIISKDGESTAPLDILCQSLVTLTEKEENYTYVYIYIYINISSVLKRRLALSQIVFSLGRVKDWSPLERPQWQSLDTGSDWTNNTSEQNFNNCFPEFL